jgi:copper oxidase (laccase) domain-containing protein
MRSEFGSRVEDLVAAVGPSIGGCCFEVGDEVAGAFSAEFVSEVDGRAHVDLWAENRGQLLRAGVPVAGITVMGECAACARVEGERKYFSYRAEKGRTGRMLSVVGVVEAG